MVSTIRTTARVIAVALLAATLGTSRMAGPRPANADGGGCTVVTIARGGRVIFAGNDDYVVRDTVYWVDPGGPGRYGAIWFGTRDNVQQGFNEKGLAYDANGLPTVPTNPHRERAPVAGGYTSYPIHILRSCATVDEVIAWVRSHEWHDRMWDQLHFADSSGDAVVISAGPDGELVFSRKARGDGFLVSTNFNVANPANGDYPCWRYSLATERLSRIRSTGELDIGKVATVMDAVHVASPAVFTNWTVVADLVSRTVNVYYFHQFDRPITLRVDDELARRPADVRLSTMFPAETIARADAAYGHLAAARLRASAAAFAWLAVVLGSVVLVWSGPAGRWHRIAAAVALGPPAAGAWLTTGRGRAPLVAGPWRDIVWSAARAMPPYVAGTVLALSGALTIPAIRQAPGLQLLVIYGVPLVLGWLYRPVFPASAGGSTPGPGLRFLQTIVTGHLTMAGIWLVVMTALNLVVRTVGPGGWAIVFSWALAALGSLLGGALVMLYFAVSPSPAWRRSWWWVPLSLVLLAGGAAAGLVLSRWVA